MSMESEGREPPCQDKMATESCFWCAQTHHSHVQSHTVRGTERFRCSRALGDSRFSSSLSPGRQELRDRAKVLEPTSQGWMPTTPPRHTPDFWKHGSVPNNRHIYVKFKSPNSTQQKQTNRALSNKIHDEKHELEECANPRAGGSFEWLQPNRNILWD